LAPIFAEFLLVDYRPQEDLMFWDQLIRSLSNAKRTGRWICVVVGSSEIAERILFQRGLPSNRSSDGELDFPASISAELDLVYSEEKRKLATRMTDEGISAVGMTAYDRGMVQIQEGQLNARKGIENILWPAPAVVPLLMSVVKDGNDCLKDVHPFRLASKLQEHFGERASFTVISDKVSQGEKTSWIAWETKRKAEGKVSHFVSDEAQNILKATNWGIQGPVF